MKFNAKLLGIIIVVLLSLILFKQQKIVGHCDRLKSMTSNSFESLAHAFSAAEGRLARENAAHHASLVASLEEFKSTQSAVTIVPVESKLAMRITCKNGEQIELANAQLISNGKSSESLSLRPDSFAFWLQIPWTGISKVTVRKSGTDTRPMGVVTLKDGTTNEYLIHSSEVRGKSDLGQIQIAIPDVSEIVNITEAEERQ